MTTRVSRAELEAQGRQIVEQLGGRWSATGGGMCRCPAHADGSPSLSVRVGNATLLFHCFAGCATIDVMRALRADGVVDGVRSSEPAEPNERRSLQPLAEKVWLASRGLSGTLAERYLASRGLESHSAQLRFHPHVQLGPTADATFHPAMIAAVRDDTGLVALHRTLLDPATGGQANMPNPKRMLAEPGRGAVRLGTATRVLGLAEGIETAIAASRIHGIPVWAALGNERFGMVQVPSHVERLVILADNDAGGRRAADLATTGHARAGLTIETVWPPEPHNDWADVLAAAGEGRGQGGG